MKQVIWGILVIGLVGLVVMSSIVIPQYQARDTIRGVNDESFLDAMSSAISPDNTHFSRDKLSVHDIAIISDTVAVAHVNTHGDEGTVYAIFELHDARLHLTNYSPNPFTSSDFANESDVTQHVIYSTGNSQKQ